MLDAVLASRPRSPLDAHARLQALKKFLQLPEAGVLTAINKRIANILSKSPLRRRHARAGTRAVSRRCRARRCMRRHRQLRDRSSQRARRAQLRRGLRALTALRGAVDQFFDQVMVMDENPELRNNRLALLREVQALLGGVADLSRLPG